MKKIKIRTNFDCGSSLYITLIKHSLDYDIYSTSTYYAKPYEL